MSFWMQEKKQMNITGEDIRISNEQMILWQCKKCKKMDAIESQRTEPGQANKANC